MKSHQWDVKSMKDKDKWVIKLESEKKVANKKELSSNDPCIDLEMKFHRRKWFRSICIDVPKIQIKRLDPVRL